MSNKPSLEELHRVLKNSLKKEEAVGDSGKDSGKDLATEVGAGAGKAFGWMLVACTKIAIEVFKVFVAIWLLHYFGFLPLNG